ncbi:hypothetical protein, partial [Peribacillus deserti]|uniref:hypothetical protein n=1 Tax=Peribacillus deserti TaxID=673318 RepID=UPI001C609AF8
FTMSKIPLAFLLQRRICPSLFLSEQIRQNTLQVDRNWNTHKKERSFFPLLVSNLPNAGMK